ncbi:MAG: hypothetical protein RL653_337 [Pseudomonadota bacterium]
MSSIRRGPSRPAAPQVPREAQALERSQQAQKTKGEDGSTTTTRRRQTAKTTKQLTTRQTRLGEKQTEYRRSQDTARGHSELTYTSNRDLLGRTQSQVTRESTTNSGRHTVSTQSRDAFGIDKQTRQVTSSRVDARGQETITRRTSNDSVGNRSESRQSTRVAVDGNTVTTTVRGSERGSELNTRAQATYQDQKFTWADGADWSRRASVQRSVMRETAVQRDISPMLRRYDRVAGGVGRVFQRLGLEKQWQTELGPQVRNQAVLASGRGGSVVAEAVIEGHAGLSVDAQGIRADFERTAGAGLYARSEGQVDGRYGSARYDASAKAEAVATVSGQGRIDANGLDAVVEARVGATVEVEVNASARTRGIRVGDTELYAGVAGHAKASASLEAHADGRVTVTRHPPTAVIRGSAGASAVAKAEASVTASAGPFSVSANVYGSAGAEARADGIIGYEDGKFRIGGSLGAAVGLGAGGGATVEVDVGMMKDMAHDAADLNNDGKLGWADVGHAAVAGVRATVRGVRTVRQVARAADVNGDGRVGLGDLRAAASRGVRSAASRVAHAADVNGDGRVGLADAGAAVGRSARRVAGWFGF